MGAKVTSEMITLCLLLSLTASTVVGQYCNKKTACSCSLASGGNDIDISSLGRKNGKPRFDSVPSLAGYHISYNPCYPFSSSGACNQVAGCLIQSDGVGISLGSQDTATFTTDITGTTTIAYGNTGGSRMLVRLVCDPTAHNPTLLLTGDNENTYYLTLTSRCACPGECVVKKEGVSDHVGVPGLVLLLLLIFGIALYFIIGVLWNKYRRGATGIEVIPHLAFWQDFPNLVKEGVLFTCSPCKKGYKKLKGEDEQYEDNSRIVQKDQPPTYNYGT